MARKDRRHSTLAIILIAVLLSAGTAPAGIVSASAAMEAENSTAPEWETATTEQPRIVELYPNPVADGNVGEFVAIEFPTEMDPRGLALHDDGRQKARLPETTLDGTVVFSHDPAETRTHTDHEVYPLDGHIQFAEDGETVTLRRNGTIVDSVQYDRATEAELWERDGDTKGSWRPIEATDLDPARVGDGEATAFVLPDASDRPVELIEDADERIMLAAYTYSDARITEALLDAHERGVDVQVAVEASPVGGTTERSAAQLDELTAAGIDVVAFGGDTARYRFHHAKFAVVDDEALVMTENWKPSGSGGQSNRGWGVVTHDGPTADAIADVFVADLEASDSIPWATYRDSVAPVEEPATAGTYPVEFTPERVPLQETTVLTAPDNAETEIRREIQDAEESIRLTQMSIGGRDDPLLREALDAARRGVELRILLSSAWYAEEENTALRAWLDDLAADENLDVEVRLANPGGRYEKLHTKGVVVDSETVILGSINWNTHSLRENRELALVLDGEEVGSYYADVFDADWAGLVWRFPIGLGVVLVVAGVGTAETARRRVTFE